MSYSNSGYPESQPSAGYPLSQPSAGFAGSQPSASYPSSQASAPYLDPQQGYGQAPGGQPPHGQWAPQVPRPKEDNFFSALFDFGFTQYATPSVVKLLYILGIVVGGLAWLLSGIGWLILGGMMSALNPYSGGGGGLTVIGVLSWIFGLIPLFFWIVALRVGLEYALATVRINQDTKVIRQSLEAPTAV